jgi:hypothetical protein
MELCDLLCSFQLRKLTLEYSMVQLSELPKDFNPSPHLNFGKPNSVSRLFIVDSLNFPSLFV